MKTILSIFLTVCFLSAMSQESIKKEQKKKNQDDVYFTPEQKVVKKKESKYAPGLAEWSSQADKTQVDHIITCLDDYHRERLTAFTFGIGGMAVAGLSFAVSKNYAPTLYVIGGIFELGSAIMLIHAERLISRKNLTFTGNGLTLKF